MRRQPDPARTVAADRRLAQLGAELAALHGPTEESENETIPDTGEPEGGHTRIRVERWARWWPDEVVAPEPLAGTDPVGPPGRHAARRTAAFRRRPDDSSFWAPSGRWEAWRDRVAVAPVHLSLVAVVVAVLVAGSCWWVVRGQGGGAAAPGGAVGAGGAPSGDAVPAAGRRADQVAPVVARETVTPSASPHPELVVDVTGRVRRPGIQVLPSGARVMDAITAAGGARPQVDLSTLNLARVLTDGEQVVVGARPGPEGPVPGGASTGGASVGGPVSLNAADQAALESLPGVGPVTANAILAYRSEHGGFGSVEELIDVSGIGEATLARLAPLVTL